MGKKDFMSTHQSQLFFTGSIFLWAQSDRSTVVPDHTWTQECVAGLLEQIKCQ